MVKRSVGARRTNVKRLPRQKMRRVKRPKRTKRMRASMRASMMGTRSRSGVRTPVIPVDYRDDMVSYDTDSATILQGKIDKLNSIPEGPGSYGTSITDAINRLETALSGKKAKADQAEAEEVADRASDEEVMDLSSDEEAAEDSRNMPEFLDNEFGGPESPESPVSSMDMNMDMDMDVATEDLAEIPIKHRIMPK